MFAKTLVGKTVVLREIVPEKDSVDWFQHMQESKMHKWTGNTVPKEIEEVIDLLQRYKELPYLTSWVITMKDTKEVIGTYWIMNPIKKKGQYIIESEAQRLAVKYWRKGIMKEARSLVYSYTFNDLNVDAIYAQAWSQNENSCKSMEQAGFVINKEYERKFDKINKVCIEKEFLLSKEIYHEFTIKSQI